MNVLEAIYNEIEEIKHDFLGGSSQIALKALDIVTAVIDLNPYKDDKFPVFIAETIRNLKPAMAAVEVICSYALKDYAKHKDKVKKYYCVDIRNKMFRASEATILKAYHKLFMHNTDDFYYIATCSFSSNIIKFLRFADEHNKKIKLFVIKSVWNNIDYSENLVSELNHTGILSKIISIDEFKKIKDIIDFTVVGADGYDYNSNVVNGVPTKDLVEESNGNNFYVITESFKKTKKLKTDDGFEFIPSKYITEIISDHENWLDDEEELTLEEQTQTSTASRGWDVQRNL